MLKKIKKELLNCADRKYKDFSTSLLPNVNNVIGVRLPKLRQMAKEIIKSDWETFLNQNTDEFMELTMLEGMVIAGLKLDFSETLKLSEKFISKINNWSVCDSFCCSLKSVKKNKKETKEFLKKYLSSKDEFENRFAFVILLDYFVDDDYPYVIKEISKFNNDFYYAQMAAAWCLSICLVKHFETCLADIKKLKLHPFVFKKGIQKAIESYRLTNEQKEILRECIKTKANV